MPPLRAVTLHRAVIVAAAIGAAACVSGEKIRADAEVIRHDVERARKSGAYKCAPRELALAEAHLDFALGEVSEGNSVRGHDHVRIAEDNAKKALVLSKDCGPKQVLIRDQDKKAPTIVKIDKVDTDGDGIPDNEDKCPTEPEDKDGFEDEDGCPEPDNDKDGIYDTEDACPLVPGVRQPDPKRNGCPLEQVKDSDGDGIPDDIDRCPADPEDKDGFQDEDGCPDPDNDNDGVLDKVDQCPMDPGTPTNNGCPIKDRDGDGIFDDVDKCPDEPEDKDGFEDQDGCPDLDNDKDGIPDSKDACPNDPGIASDDPTQNGCPRKYRLVVVKRERIEIKKQIKFAFNKAIIQGKISFEILDEVAQVLRDFPQIRKVRIEGHTDSIGNDAYNLKLSQSRADAVLNELLKRGIESYRMESVGYGETKPIASNATERGRAENRRTEFNIIERE